MVTADGISREQANSKFWAVEKKGLLYERDVGIKNMDSIDQTLSGLQERVGVLPPLSKE
jgi:hypothetical protein